MLDPDRNVNSSYELKTLYGRLSLMSINIDGLLLIRVLIGGPAREVVVCSPTLREQLIKAVHRQSHQSMMGTYYRMQRHWYWPGMCNKIRMIV